MAIEITERVWRCWRRFRADAMRPVMALAFRSDLSEADATSALSEAVGDAITELDDDEGEFRLGELDVGSAPGMALLRVYDPDDLGLLLRHVAGYLERRGIDGTLDLYDPPPREQAPDAIDLLECRLRVAGERGHSIHRQYYWREDPRALARVVAAGLRWCTALGGELALTAGVLPTIAPAPGDDVERRLREAVAAGWARVDLVSGRAGTFRVLAVAPSGRVTLIEAGQRLREQDWQEPAQELTRFLAEISPDAVYGFIKRGSSTPEALTARSLTNDWPAPADAAAPISEPAG